MAETVVSSLIDRMATLLDLEARLLGGIRGEVANIKDELESIQSFLKDADARAAAEQGSSDVVKTWVKQVRGVAFCIDVAIDQYLLQVALHDPHRTGFHRFLQKTTHLLKTIIPRHKIAAKIQKIKAKVQNINERSKSYGLQSTAQGSCTVACSVSWNDPRKDSLYLNDADVVGIELSKDELISWLVDERVQCGVISVEGMAGLGKTTLAKKVYDDQTVKKYFEYCAWISVSESNNTKDLLRSMIKQFYEVKMETPPTGMDSMDEESLIKKVRDYLQQKRYVVVFDDIWKNDFWEGIKHAFLDNGESCRIIITTRNLEVADFCNKSPHVSVLPYKLQPLPPVKARELFYKRAFQFHGGYCPPELKKLSREIVEKCEGLPIAISAIGGLLSTKQTTLSVWKDMHDNLGFELARNSHLASVNKVLSLSYEDLPYHLKSCFLYFGMYPSKCHIVCARLIQKWIAEGFVHKIRHKTSEDIAREYLTELINRSLVQIIEVDFCGEVQVCRIHDILHGIILQKIEDSRFCYALSEEGEEESSFEGLTRRILVSSVSHGSVSHGVLEKFKKFHVNSLLFFNNDEFPKSFMDNFIKNVKLMKVLDFENTPLDHLPEDVGNLFHLKFLNLNYTKVKTLPNSIGKLQNLESLLLLGTLIQEVPYTIYRLNKLRCLLAQYYDANMDFNINNSRGVKFPGRIGCLKAIEQLRLVDANHGGLKLIEELGKLTQLRDLCLVNLTRETGRALFASIGNMNFLKSLFVSSINEVEIIDLQSISSPPKCLQFLCIKGRLAMLPDWISELQHLVSLKLYGTRLSDDPLKVIQYLPNLVELILGMEAYNGGQLQITKGGFPKLKVLWLVGLSNLNLLNMPKELPLLEKLSIERCPQLKQQKIVIKVGIGCEKCASKTMKIAANANGVNSVAIEGSDRDQLVVIGEGVDFTNLTDRLREKLGYANLQSVVEVKVQNEPEDPEGPE